MTTTYTYKTKTYFVLTFASTYTLWLAGAFVSFQNQPSNIYMPLMLSGLMMPFLISTAMIARSSNRCLIRDYMNRVFNPKLINPGMLPALFLMMPATVLIAIGISVTLGGNPEQFHLAEGFSFSPGFMPVLLILLAAAFFEEAGWRGYAFDSLQERCSLLKASLIFGVLWSLWHFPLIFVKNSYQYEIFHQNLWFGLNFFISIIPLGILVSWICIKNRKSVLAAIAFHFIINISQEATAMTQETKCIQTVVIIVCAFLIVIFDRKLFMKKTAEDAI